MSDETLSRRHAWTIALLATFTMTVSQLDRQTLAVLAPTVTAALHISDSSYGWLGAAFSLAYLVSTPLAGRWIDAFGARRGLLPAVALWSAIAAGHALAPGFGSLFALRILLGIAESPSFPGAAQTIARTLPVADRPRGFGILFTGSSLGAILAPILATTMHARFGWRGAFVGTAMIGLAWIPLWLGATYSGAASRALDLRSESASRPSFRAVIAHEAVQRSLAMILLAAAPVTAFVLLWGAKYLASVHHLTQAAIGPRLIVPLVLFDLGAIVFGDLATRRARRLAARADLAPASASMHLVGAAALVCTVTLLPLANGPAIATWILGVAMAGAGGVFAIAVSDMMARIPASTTATAGGILAAGQSLSYIVVSPIIGYSVETRLGYVAPALMVAALALPACGIWMLWRAPSAADRRAT